MIHRIFSKEHQYRMHQAYLNDPVRHYQFKKIIHYINIAPVKHIIKMSGFWKVNSVTTEILEPFKSIIDKLRDDLEKYELEAYPELLQTKTPTN
jgi:hypothetical protein